MQKSVANAIQRADLPTETLVKMLGINATPNYCLHDVRGDGRCSLYALSRALGRELTPHNNNTHLRDGYTHDLLYLNAQFKRHPDAEVRQMFKKLLALDKERGNFESGVGDPIAALAHANESRRTMWDIGYQYVVVLRGGNREVRGFVQDPQGFLRAHRGGTSSNGRDDRVYRLRETGAHNLNAVYEGYRGIDMNASQAQNLANKLCSGQVVIFVSNGGHWRVALPMSRTGKTRSGTQPGRYDTILRIMRAANPHRAAGNKPCTRTPSPKKPPPGNKPRTRTPSPKKPSKSKSPKPPTSNGKSPTSNEELEAAKKLSLNLSEMVARQRMEQVKEARLHHDVERLSYLRGLKHKTKSQKNEERLLQQAINTQLT